MAHFIELVTATAAEAINKAKDLCQIGETAGARGRGQGSVESSAEICINITGE